MGCSRRLSSAVPFLSEFLPISLLYPVVCVCVCVGGKGVGTWWGNFNFSPSPPELVSILTPATVHFSADLYSSHYLSLSNYSNFDEDTKGIWFPLMRVGGTVNVDHGNTDSHPVSGITRCGRSPPSLGDLISSSVTLGNRKWRDRAAVAENWSRIGTYPRAGHSVGVCMVVTHEEEEPSLNKACSRKTSNLPHTHSP